MIRTNVNQLHSFVVNEFVLREPCFRYLQIESESIWCLWFFRFTRVSGITPHLGAGVLSETASSHITLFPRFLMLSQLAQYPARVDLCCQ